jgi:hypothetical protein
MAAQENLTPIVPINSETEIVKATHGSPDHPLRIGDIEIPCYVLEDGRRVLVQTSVVTALGMKQGGSVNARKADQLAEFANEKNVQAASKQDRLSIFVSGKALQPHVSADLLYRITNPIKFRTPRGQDAYGYEATILVEICEAILKARDEGKLQAQQAHISRQADILMRGFAHVGIIALVDEATGYQEVRDRDALHKILEAYIAKELLPWTKRFPDEFYRQMFRLRGWQYSPMSTKGPRYAGQLTNEIVYDRLPLGVLDELRRKNPIVKDGRREHKHHQFLTENIGNPHLEKHLARHSKAKCSRTRRIVVRR